MSSYNKFTHPCYSTFLHNSTDYVHVLVHIRPLVDPGWQLHIDIHVSTSTADLCHNVRRPRKSDRAIEQHNGRINSG